MSSELACNCLSFAVNARTYKTEAPLLSLTTSPSNKRRFDSVVDLIVCGAEVELISVCATEMDTTVGISIISGLCETVRRCHSIARLSVSFSIFLVT